MDTPKSAEQAKARRALVILYVAMFVGIALPGALYLVLR
jgi:hypothetical protein